MALGIVVSVRNDMLDAIDTAIGASGNIRFFSGSRPATGGAETTLLAECALSATAAGAATGGTLTFNAVSDGTVVNAASPTTCTWGRFATSADGAVVDFDVGTSGSDMNFDAVSWSNGGTVSVSSVVLTAGNA